MSGKGHAKRLKGLEDTMELWVAPGQPSRISEIERAWRDYWVTHQYLSKVVAPRLQWDCPMPDLPWEEFRDALITCGAAHLRSWARLIQMGELPNPNPAYPEGQLAREMIERADELDATHTPDLSAYQWTVGEFAHDEQGKFVGELDEVWTWRDRLEAVQQFERRHGVRFGFNQRPDITFIRDRRAIENRADPRPSATKGNRNGQAKKGCCGEHADGDEPARGCLSAPGRG